MITRTALQQADQTAKREFENFIMAVGTEDLALLLDCIETTAKVEFQGYEFPHSQIRTEVDPIF